MKIKITLMEEMLGTGCANPDVHEEFIAAKSADADKAAEEMAAMPAEEAMEKAVTVFARDEAGNPILWDYQVKGFFKEAIGVLLDYIEKDIKVGKAKLSKWTAKKVVDNVLFVYPRQIGLVLPKDGTITHCTRPLRADTMKGERVALATSEQVPAGTTMELEITWLNGDIEPLVRKALDYGKLKGLGQWRNSGKGRFTWEEIG